MSTASQPHGSAMQRAPGARDAMPADVPQYDDTELGCESAYPFLQFDGWEPMDAQRAGAAPGY